MKPEEHATHVVELLAGPLSKKFRVKIKANGDHTIKIALNNRTHANLAELRTEVIKRFGQPSAKGKHGADIIRTSWSDIYVLPAISPEHKPPDAIVVTKVGAIKQFTARWAEHNQEQLRRDLSGGTVEISHSK